MRSENQSEMISCMNVDSGRRITENISVQPKFSKILLIGLFYVLGDDAMAGKKLLRRCGHGIVQPCLCVFVVTLYETWMSV